MAPLTDEEKRAIEEEEEIRVKVRLKFQKRSSGTAGVLSGICPGLGQIYNGQLYKASAFLASVLIGLVLLVAGILFLVRGMPSGDSTYTFQESESFDISDEGIVMDPDMEEFIHTGGEERIPASPLILIVVGLTAIIIGRNYSIKDAMKTAEILNRIQ